MMTTEEHAQRQFAVNQITILANAKGMPFSAETKAILKRFSDGELEFEEMRTLALRQMRDEMTARGGSRKILDTVGDAPCQTA